MKAIASIPGYSYAAEAAPRACVARMKLQAPEDYSSILSSNKRQAARPTSAPSSTPRISTSSSVFGATLAPGRDTCR